MAEEQHFIFGVSETELREFAKDNFDKPLTDAQVEWIKEYWYEANEHPKLNWINAIITEAQKEENNE